MLEPADFAFSSTVSRTASTGFEPEPLPLDLLARLLDLLDGRLRDLLVDPVLLLAAGLPADLLEPLLLFAAVRAFGEFALVDFDLRDELLRVAFELFFV